MSLTTFFKSILDGGKVDINKRYVIMRDAVSGTMSNFHMARDRETEQIVGLKILDKHKTEQLEMRFRGLDKPSEGQIAVLFDHPRVVRTLGHGITTKGEQFIVMEYLDGPGLNSLIIPARKEFMQPGIRTGTPSYMAPEVVRRKPTDHRLDIFAFGVSMYEMYCFNLPWQRGSGDGMAAMSHGQSEPTPLVEICPGIHPKLSAAIRKCMATEPDMRMQSMNQFLSEIAGVRHENVDPAAKS